MTTTALPSGVVLTRQDVARAARVSVATVDRAIHTGHQRANYIAPGGRLVRVHRDDFEQWIGGR
jgi:excisionase family DNA binding protein